MRSTDNKTAALDYLRGLEHVAEGDPAAIEITGGAQVHATLYLAEQQRVANLLAAAKLILDSKNVKYGVLGVADWATDSDADVHEALATSSVWVALLGCDEAKRKGMTT